MDNIFAINTAKTSTLIHLFGYSISVINKKKLLSRIKMKLTSTVLLITFVKSCILITGEILCPQLYTHHGWDTLSSAVYSLRVRYSVFSCILITGEILCPQLYTHYGWDTLSSAVYSLRVRYSVLSCILITGEILCPQDFPYRGMRKM